MSDQKRANDGDLKRREFLTRAAAAGGALAASAAAGCASVVGTPPGASSSSQTADAAAPRYRQPLADAPELQKVGGVKHVKYRGKDFFVVRKSQTEVIALENVCSHKKCKTKYSADDAEFRCPCHSSGFDLNGKALRGPAVNSGPLNQYPAELSGNVIQVTLSS